MPRAKSTRSRRTRKGPSGLPRKPSECFLRGPRPSGHWQRNYPGQESLQRSQRPFERHRIGMEQGGNPPAGRHDRRRWPHRSMPDSFLR